MHTTLDFRFVLVLFASATAALAQSTQAIVVPAAYASTDAPGRCWIAGGHKDLRQQTLVGASHLGALVGRAITGVEFRRSDEDRAYVGGTANMTVVLSISASDPQQPSEYFAMNSGALPVQVFQGAVAFPASPATTTNTVPWTVDNVVHIGFTQPFVYTGGTLCVDIQGMVVAGQIASRWHADAAYDFTTGAVVEQGPGCGLYANSLGQWSFVTAKTLLPGSVMDMYAYGPENNWVVAAIGPAGGPFPLSLLGLGQPGCNAHITDMAMMHITTFAPMGEPLIQHRGGLAEYPLPIPNLPWVLGVQMTTQWLDVIALHSSNAVTWTIAATTPTLDMALVDGIAGDATGNVSTYKAHVLRFEYQ